MRKILIVDDEVSVRDSLRMIFKKEGLLQIVWVKISLKISNSPLFMRFL